MREREGGGGNTGTPAGQWAGGGMVFEVPGGVPSWKAPHLRGHHWALPEAPTLSQNGPIQAESRRCVGLMLR